MHKYVCAWLVIVPLLPAQTSVQFVDWAATQRVCCVAADRMGNIYVAGDVLIPVAGSSPQSFFTRAAVTKFDSDNRVVYTFHFPGRQSAQALAVNAEGEVFVGGSTDGVGFPTINPLPAPAVSGSGSAFLSKLDASGTKLLFSSVIGRSTIDAITLDNAGNVVVAGSTSASDFPVTDGAYQRSGPQRESFGTPVYAVVARVSGDGSRWMHATFLGDGSTWCSGGSVCIGKYGNTVATSIAIGRDGAIQIAGSTSTDRFPTTAGAFQPSAPLSRPAPTPPMAVGFLTRFRSDLSALEWSTYFGKLNLATVTGDSIRDMALAGDGSVFIAGFAASPDFPVTEGSFSATPRAEYRFDRQPAYAARFSAAGSLVFSTYLDGPALPSGGLRLLADREHDPHITFQMAPPRRGNAVLFELAADGRRAVRIQQLPGGSTGGGLVRDSSNRVVVSGAATGSILRIAADESTPAVFGKTNIAWNQTSREIAPGEIIRLHGSNLGGADLQVRLGDGAAPLLYAGEDSIEAIVPFAVASRRSVPLEVVTAAGRSNAVELAVAPSVPEIFAKEDGSAAALNEDGSLNSSSNRASPGSIVAFYVNGAGLFEPEVADGTIASEPLPRLALPVTATCDLKPVDIVYAGAAPGLVAGVSQINLRLDGESPSTTFCSIAVGGRSSHSRSIFVGR